MAGLTAAEGFSSRYSSAVWSNTDQQLLGADCSPLLQKVCLGVGSPKGYPTMDKITSCKFILLAQWSHMSNVSKQRPSGYDVCHLGVLMGMAQYRFAFSFTVYTWPLNSEALLRKGNQYFGILSSLRNSEQVSSQACCSYNNNFYRKKSPMHGRQ